MVEEKVCMRCNELKKASEFTVSKYNKSGLKSYCKSCINEKNKEYRKEEKTILREKKYKEDNKEKYKEYFNKYYIENVEKIKETANKHYYDNHEQRLEYNKKYREENSEKMAEYKKNWENKNRLMLNERKNEFNRKNPHIVAWRSMLQNTIKRMDTIKEGHTIEQLGYSAEQLKNHMQNLFTIGMSWENHGEWHIDHIKPVSSFDKMTPVNIVCALDNLQPLWATTREINGVVYEGNLNKIGRAHV